MARTFGKSYLKRWGEDEWRALTLPAQWLYEMLYSHELTSWAGTIALQPSLWSRLAAGVTVAKIRRPLAELEEARFIVVDPTTDEVLVRTFIRYDDIVKSPNLVVPMIRAYRKVESERIREAIQIELRRCVNEIGPSAGVSRLLLDDDDGGLCQTLYPEVLAEVLPHPLTEGFG